MTLVRERRHQPALWLSLPPPVSAADFSHQTPLPSLQSSTGLDSPGIGNLSVLEKLAVLGHGNGGTVYKVRHQKTSSFYALKVLRFGEDAVTIRQQAAREVEILKRVDSQYVVRCHGVFENGFVNSDGGGDLCFVMEYMEAGSLHDVLRVRRRLPENVISGVARCVLEGLHYLHGMQIVHRDIKPSNLLINGKGETKIADFGVSRVGAGTIEALDSYMGTCAYMSPERFDPERWNGDCSDGFAGDVWSLGVVVLECHVGHFPFISPGQKPDWATLMCAICFGEKAEMPEKASPEFQSFVWRCLEKDWRKRGTVAELLGHPFVTKCCDSTTEKMVDYALDC
ncbi:mitogen-activated protein kinase kinase 10 [Cornus florida]|uniref:mitogen-activated protein kinase kinase 10 n=1 Tax=Cornus florida TaxID=4283 RepID=UPI00289C60A2|nr:mitogen-activated protein kinase kinase 10 [Cornus florida]